MKNNKKGKFRVFCPSDNIGFETTEPSKIFCRHGDHYLSFEFPPKKDFWAYCCGCQRYFPFSIHDNKDDIKLNCIACGRKIAKRFLCSVCNTISIDLKRATVNKIYNINSDNGVSPSCPSCSTIAEIDKITLHNCEILGESLYSTRESCPFCGKKINSFKQVQIKTSNPKEEITEVTAPRIENSAPTETPVFPDTEQIEQVVRIEESQPIIYKSESDVVQDNSKDILNISLSDNKTKHKTSSSIGGCFIVIALLLVVSLCVIFSKTNSSNNTVELAANTNTAVNSPPNVNPRVTPSPVNSSPSVRSFRYNSTVIVGDAVLRGSPETYGEEITILEVDTLIRIVDRKTATSKWYKIKTENGEEGWIDGYYIAPIDWNLLSCKENESGYTSGGNLRSSPQHSVNEENILAIWDTGSKVKVLSIIKGEAGIKTGNPYWYKVKIIEGTCSFDSRTSKYKSVSCESEDVGYMNSSLIDCD